VEEMKKNERKEEEERKARVVRSPGYFKAIVGDAVGVWMPLSLSVWVICKWVGGLSPNQGQENKQGTNGGRMGAIELDG